MSVFNFESYEDYLQDILEAHADNRGYRSKLAKAAKVHPSYVTRICNGTASLTPDQAAALAEFWGLASFEKEYFVWMVLKARASDPSFRKMAEEKLQSIKHRHDELGTSLSADKIDPVLESIYYQNWIYSAIHLLATLAIEMTPQQIAERLGLPEVVVNSAVQQLENMGLAKRDAHAKVRATNKNIHLSNKSWMANLQHKNWRIAALDRLGREGTVDSRYTGVHTLSKKDLEKLRRQIREFLVQTDQLVRPSKEETACVLCVDLFEL